VTQRGPLVRFPAAALHAGRAVFLKSNRPLTLISFGKLRACRRNSGEMAGPGRHCTARCESSAIVYRQTPIHRQNVGSSNGSWYPRSVHPTGCMGRDKKKIGGQSWARLLIARPTALGLFLSAKSLMFAATTNEAAPLAPAGLAPGECAFTVAAPVTCPSQPDPPSLVGRSGACSIAALNRPSIRSSRAWGQVPN
jgi:hypothetical protein